MTYHARTRRNDGMAELPSAGRPGRRRQRPAREGADADAADAARHGEAREALGLASDAEHATTTGTLCSTTRGRSSRRFSAGRRGWWRAARAARQCPTDLARTVARAETLLAPDMAVLWNGEPEDGAAGAGAGHAASRRSTPTAATSSAREWEASPHQRLERLLRETGVGVGILVARNTLRLIYAPRGETAGWISWPLAALGRVEGRPMLAGLKLCLGRNAFFTGAPETRLRPLLEGLARSPERGLGEAVGSGARRAPRAAARPSPRRAGAHRGAGRDATRSTSTRACSPA